MQINGIKLNILNIYTIGVLPYNEDKKRTSQPGQTIP